MARPATGQVIVDSRRRSPTFALRFRAYGKREYIRLGTVAEGWTHAKAQIELQNVLAEVRLGIWRPQTPEVADSAPRTNPTFHEFASKWFERQKLEGGRRGGGLSGAATADLQWRLSNHLLPAFARKRLDQITIEDVDRYRLAKRAEGKLGVTSINKTLATLSAILEVAAEYGLIDRNPASGRRRRLPAVAPERAWLDRADHIIALLDGASELDDGARVFRGQRRALIATLVFAGLRIDECLSLRFRDVDLARGTIAVRKSKTPAGVRMVDMLPALRDELAAYRSGLNPCAEALVFSTARGTRLSQTNVRTRVLAKAVERANAKLAANDSEPLPARISHHDLRRTFASILYALGEDPAYVMEQLGHSSPALSLAIYARKMNRRDGEPERLRALVSGEHLVESTEINRQPVEAAKEPQTPKAA